MLSPRETGPALQAFNDYVWLAPKTYTADKALRPSGTCLLNRTSTGLTMTLEAPKAAGQLLIISQVDGGTAGHTVTCASGVTFNGTNTIATFNAQYETLVLVSLSTTRWLIVLNNGSVGLSGP